MMLGYACGMPDLKKYFWHKDGGLGACGRVKTGNCFVIKTIQHKAL
jgi:hypothetical protein